MIAAAVLAAAVSAAAPHASDTPDGEYRAALVLLYDGSTDGALSRLAALAAAHPQDPIGAYLEALALVWKIEQRPHSTALDAELHRRLDRTIALASAHLGRDPRDARALLARGAAHGVRSRLHLFRQHRGEAPRAAVKMREDLLALRELSPQTRDADFGLGLYDYYADVLPRLFRVLRFLARIPGGDRERGLALVESARVGSTFHDDEAAAQLYEIHAFYEHAPDRALALARDLRTRHPGSPLWALKLAEHLRVRLGLYAESATVAGEILAQCRKGHPNYAGEGLVALARAALGEALLLDGRLGEARAALLPVKDGVPDAPGAGPKARLLLGRSLELEGDRDGAEAHYRIAATAADREVRRQARRALDSPLPANEVRGRALVWEARRARAAGHQAPAIDAFRAALRFWPESDEARLRAAEDDLAHGRLEEAEEALETLEEREATDPPWVKAWARLLEGRRLDLRGERAAAVQRYKEVLQEPYGSAELAALARQGVDTPYREPAQGVSANHRKLSIHETLVFHETPACPPDHRRNDEHQAHASQGFGAPKRVSAATGAARTRFCTSFHSLSPACRGVWRGRSEKKP